MRQSESRKPELGVPTVTLVGAGPGDVELLTIKAVRRLQAAEVVVYDRLVSQDVLDLIPKGTTRIYAGKASGAHARPQDETNDLLVKLAQAGHRVVRLKGGDPLVGVPCEIVPGITAAAGCAASIGLPLTHRGLATSVRFVTGHCCAGRPLDLNWASLADPDTTLVVYMGLAHVSDIACRLIEAGLPSDTPSAAVANGTLQDEQVVVATLATLADRVQSAGLSAPVLFVIGRVIEVLEELRACRAPVPEIPAEAPERAQNA